jgi:lysozyme
MKITSISNLGLSLIKQFEGFRMNSYLCPANVWTIGYGSTRYSDGRKVKQGDVITEHDAHVLLLDTVKAFEKAVDDYTTDAITQPQFDALVCFAYNVGAANLKNSTLLRKVNANTADPAIRDEFNKWVYAGGKKLKGLMERRKAEADLYFS